MNNREIGRRNRESILHILSKYPEGLNAKEMLKLYSGEYMKLDSLHRYLSNMCNRGLVRVIDETALVHTYIHKDYTPKESIVDRHYRERNRRIDFYTQGRDGRVMKSRYTLLKMLETYSDPITIKEFLYDVYGKDYSDVDMQRIRMVFYDLVNEGLIEKTVLKGKSNKNIRVWYRIPYLSKDERTSVIEQSPSIGYLYHKYIRYTIHLLHEKIPSQEGTEIIRCLESTKEIGNTTPKDIDLKIRVNRCEVWMYTINVTNSSAFISFIDDTLNIEGFDECMKYIKNNMELR